MGHPDVAKIQQALVNAGFFPGVVDGVWGRRTIDAVREFQESEGLLVDGIVGPRTMSRLFRGDLPRLSAPLLPWMAQAQGLLGTREGRGAVNNPVILDWADDLDLHYPGDNIAWCGLFVAHCMGAAMPEEILPNNPLGAREWMKFGDPTSPRYGAVMVFWREKREGWKGHVGFYTGESSDAYRILGGNQSDSVSQAWIAKERLLKARWPRTAVSLGGGAAIVELERTGELSTAEA
ncbi:MAG TPA: TIGR02594 family protein [Massilia sp.]|nr:TIGR02594 family protein [Massilia sp.]